MTMKIADHWHRCMEQSLLRRVPAEKQQEAREASSSLTDVNAISEVVNQLARLDILV